MHRKYYSDSEKMKHTIASYNRDVVVTLYCKYEGVSRSSIYRWRRIAGAKCFSVGTKISQMSFNLSNNTRRSIRSHVKTSRRKPRCRPL